MNTPVNFEIAKLLKEKGFPLKNTGYAYNKNGELVDPCFSIWECEAPTIAEVVMWLYEKHKIWISVGGDYNYKFKFEIHTWKWYEIEKTYRLGHTVLGESFWDTSSKAFDSPTEAYEAAIEYCLTKLI